MRTPVHESETPCCNCAHPLGMHLGGTSKSDPCEDCWCPNFTTATDCAVCFGLGTYFTDNEHERTCAYCSGTGVTG